MLTAKSRNAMPAESLTPNGVSQQSPGLPRMRLPWVGHETTAKPQRGFTRGHLVIHTLWNPVEVHGSYFGHNPGWRGVPPLTLGFAVKRFQRKGCGLAIVI